MNFSVFLYTHHSALIRLSTYYSLLTIFTVMYTRLCSSTVSYYNTIEACVRLWFEMFPEDWRRSPLKNFFHLRIILTNTLLVSFVKKLGKAIWILRDFISTVLKMFTVTMSEIMILDRKYDIVAFGTKWANNKICDWIVINGFNIENYSIISLRMLQLFEI